MVYYRLRFYKFATDYKISLTVYLLRKTGRKMNTKISFKKGGLMEIIRVADIKNICENQCKK